MKKRHTQEIRSKRIGKVSVNLDTPPTIEQLKMLMTIAGHSEQEQKELIHGSKLYGTLPAVAKQSLELKQPDKDS